MPGERPGSPTTAASRGPCAAGIDQDGTVAGRAELGVTTSQGVLWLPDGSVPGIGACGIVWTCA